MIDKLIERLNEQNFEDVFQPLPGEVVKARRTEIIKERWGLHYKELKKLSSNWRQFFEVMNDKDSIVKILVRESEVGDVIERVVFDVIFNIGQDMYVDAEKYTYNTGYVYPNERFFSDVSAAAKKYTGHKVFWNNTKTIGWIAASAKEA